MRFETFENNPEGIDLPEEIALQLSNLGLKAEKIRGKVLDVGAGNAELAKCFKNSASVNFTSIDRIVSDENKEEVLEINVKDGLPFDDESFGLIISHASIPNVFINMYHPDFPEESELEIRNAIDKSFKNILRVLKVGGEARFAPIRIAENYNSQKLVKRIIMKIVKKFEEDNSIESIFEYLREENNDNNGEKTDIYRLILKKISN